MWSPRICRKGEDVDSLVPVIISCDLVPLFPVEAIRAEASEWLVFYIGTETHLIITHSQSEYIISGVLSRSKDNYLRVACLDSWNMVISVESF